MRSEPGRLNAKRQSKDIVLNRVVLPAQKQRGHVPLAPRLTGALAPAATINPLTTRVTEGGPGPGPAARRGLLPSSHRVRPRREITSQYQTINERRRSAGPPRCRGLAGIRRPMAAGQRVGTR